MKFRKKAVVIDAELWDGTPESWNAIQDMGCIPTQDETCSMYEMIIPTLEDGSKAQVKHIATLGDYIIKGVQGEFYPCKPDIFALTYEVASVLPPIDPYKKFTLLMGDDGGVSNSESEVLPMIGSLIVHPEWGTYRVEDYLDDNGHRASGNTITQVYCERMNKNCEWKS